MNLTLSKFLNESLFVIVLYEKRADESEAYCSLKALANDANIFLFDNSPVASPTYAAGDHYQHSESNVGVSRAYNEGYNYSLIRKLKWLVLLDQDTILTPEYLQSIPAAIEANPGHELFVPSVEDIKGLLSPFRWNGVRGLRIDKPLDKLPLKTHRFINSGVVISAALFGGAGGYDESIPLDFSDIDFGERVQHIHQEVVLLPATIKTKFSSTDNLDKHPALRRYRAYSEASNKMAQKTNRALSYRWFALLRALKLSYQFRTMQFVSIFLRTAA